jgi:hypothetical protein
LKKEERQDRAQDEFGCPEPLRHCDTVEPRVTCAGTVEGAVYAARAEDGDPSWEKHGDRRIA